MSHTEDIDVWREVHFRLTLAIAKSSDNIAEEYAKRRFLLQEITQCQTHSMTTLMLSASANFAGKKRSHSKTVDLPSSTQPKTFPSIAMQHLYDAPSTKPHPTISNPEQTNLNHPTASKQSVGKVLPATYIAPRNRNDEIFHSLTETSVDAPVPAADLSSETTDDDSSSECSNDSDESNSNTEIQLDNFHWQEERLQERQSMQQIHMYPQQYQTSRNMGLTLHMGGSQVLQDVSQPNIQNDQDDEIYK